MKRKAPSTLNEPTSSHVPELSNVIYVGHVPHGFYEQQMRGFFGQFGAVTHLKLSRSKKTGRSKHYAFVEFESPEVAAIAAEAMDGYLLFTQKLVCHVMPASKLHPELFKGTEHRFKRMPWQAIEAERHNKDRTAEQQAQRLQRAVSRDRERQKRIMAAGIDYSYKPLAAKSAKRRASELANDSQTLGLEASPGQLMGESDKRKEPGKRLKRKAASLPSLEGKRPKRKAAAI